MPYCFVPHCSSGSAAKNKYYEENNMPKPRFFSPGTEERKNEWEKVIKREDTAMTLSSRVCSEHFTVSDFELEYITPVVDGSLHKIPRGKAKLNPKAIPSIFPNYPTYYQPKLSKRSAPKNRGSPKKNPKKIVLPAVEPDIVVTDDPQSSEIVHPENLQEEEEICNANASISTTPPWSCTEIHNLQKPINWVVGSTLEVTRKMIVHIDPETEQINKLITFSDHQPPIIKLRGVLFTSDIAPKINSAAAAQTLLEKIDKIKLCSGTGYKNKKFSNACQLAVKKGKRCQDCTKLHDRLRKIGYRQEKVEKRKKEKQEKKIKLKNKIQSLTRSRLNLIAKVKKYKRKVEHLIRQCQAKDETVIAEAISKLPAAQQEAVKACFAASKRKGPSGRRYTAEWIYECMLMRIKDKKLYNHIRRHEILVLPATCTINGYLKHYGGAYGFQPQVLEMLKKKTADMPAKKKER
ncbi:B-cell CLL/lymphoma 9-like protein [Frankliniella fusca]|uniref:B-cell CLL/lymphoma 9-like protein n=1 Tax=Frankliniella fusca TaxID=407009 RepID=A0AAE1LSI8_9NEOP|nr:B-cell CLL/lymphoma 9-like protein [Frankliniella fusca]